MLVYKLIVRLTVLYYMRAKIHYVATGFQTDPCWLMVLQQTIDTWNYVIFVLRNFQYII